jgi:hypothetical protein
MSDKRDSWLLEMWKIKVSKWRETTRLYSRSLVALLRARLFPASEIRKLEHRLGRRSGCGEETVIRYAGRWFALLDRAGLRPSCLVRSLALARVLRQEGYDAHLVFGVRSDNGEMEGHCWVAIGGRPVTEVPQSFKELRNE